MTVTDMPYSRRTSRTDPTVDVPLPTLLAESWAPVVVGDGRVVVLTDRPDLDAVYRSARKRLSDHEVQVLPADIAQLDDALLESHPAELDEAMTNGFGRARPHLAARSGIARWQVRALAGLGCVVVALGLAGAGEWLLLGASVLLTAITALTVTAALARLRSEPPADRKLADEELPTYTVLVPAYHEEEVIGDMIRTLERLDYPKHLLDVQILVERHDPGTELAVLAADPPPWIRIVRIPPGTLQTKPRTCNLGLQLARGELLVIFDAEDRPEPDQLRKAAARFAAGGPDLACVQARLLVGNGGTNPITRSFEQEYATRFDLIKPGLIRLGLPIPLGGTSNHFRTSALRALGGWDAWNVTEDADLGMRCAADGRRIDMIDSVTWEDSVTTLGAWVRQRTRWNKGALITTMVHTRDLTRTWRTFGARGSLVLFGLVFGNVAVGLLQPLTFWLPVLWMTGALPAPAIAAPLFALTMINMVAGAVLNQVAARRTGMTRPWVAFAVLPLYALAQTWAAVRSIVHAVRCPFHWDKTSHAAGDKTPHTAQV